MTDNPGSNTIVCQEVFHENSVPSEEEVIDYAKNIGIDPKCEQHLLPIALNGLMQPLPQGWRPCFDVKLNRWYYFNDLTKTSQWEHPLDNVYRTLVKRGRSEGYSSAAEDDSRIIKEDLKSFEEVSDLLSSKSNDMKLEKAPAEMNDFDKGKDVQPRAHQPLLLRRKQLQHNVNPHQFSPLQVVKMINNTMRESSIEDKEIKNVVTENRTFRVTPAKVGDSLTRYSSSSSLSKENSSKTLQPLRRAQTLDPIPTFISTSPKADPPIKGILRESSFSGLPNRNLARLNPIQGDTQTPHEIEDEKKRSVRFADFERKSLDIKFQFSDSDESISDEESESSFNNKEEDEEIEDIAEDVVTEEKADRKAEKLIEQLNYSQIVSNTNKEDIKTDKGVTKLSEKITNTQALAVPLEIENLSDESESVSNNTNDDQILNNEKMEVDVKSNEESFQKQNKIFASQPLHSPLKKSVNSLVNKDNVQKEEYPRYDDDNVTQISSNVSKNVCPTPIDPEIVSLRDAITSIVGGDKKTFDLESIISNKNTANIEEDAEKETQDKITQIKLRQAERLKQLKEELDKQEEVEKDKLAEAASNKLNELKMKLDIELERKEKEIREDYDKDMIEIFRRLENEKAMRISMRTNELKVNEEKEISELKNEGLKRIQEVKTFFEVQTKETEEKYQNEVKKLEAVLSQRIDQLKIEKEAELKRIQTEWDDKITANSVQNKSILETALANHEKNMNTLKQQFQKEEEALKRMHAEQVESWNNKLKKLSDKEPNSLSINRDFEKMRCEKRLIEDKYRSLKDKYLQLKSDIEIAVERKLQSKNRKKKEDHNQEKESQDEKGISETKTNNKSKNNNLESDATSDEKLPRFNRIPKINTDQLNLKEGAENDPSSDDQYTSLSLTLPNEEHRSQSISPNRADRRKDKSLDRKKLSRMKINLDGRDRQGNVLDDVRSQLKELEEIEEQIPANSQGDTYLRYPFHGHGLSNSAEVDFYRHRVIVEQEAVRAARECLLQQKRELDARQSILRSNNNTTMQQLQQQERDLTEMEVSLYRTKALLGEKMIRLRLLGQTLNRIIDDFPNSQNNTNTQKDNAITPTCTTSPGNCSTEGVPFNVLQNLENIYSEIGELQTQINKQQLDVGMAEPITTSNLYFKIPSGKPLNKTFRRVPSNRTEIETRLHDIQDWLQKTAPKQH
ncbi:centrosomal protein of 164 kDa-like isoform X2 [Cimex lectularius]|uniref:WW domain-containing protein n=1 Tax=Cimex lectularius TaxID=79782 RepID=A0A8I6R6A5_CIMLE|nr:centrosomal protein of 164 kDa-like isoform X2 [Cimex lectularius]XP_014239735.1 centrosomal protein of 164 kDa-like isoform X2 [Cimex lectularius]